MPAKKKTKAVTVLPETSPEVRVIQPAQIISEAISKGSNLAELEKVMELQERYEANLAKKAFVKAMAEFKNEDIVITKDKVNKQYDSKYTSIGNLINTVTPVLSKHGFSASWDIQQNGIIKVICKLTHALGHSETATMAAGEDKSGSKSAIQQIKSTITYLKAVTFESVCGLASSDANVDTDGNDPTKKETQFTPPPETKPEDPVKPEQEYSNQEEMEEFMDQDKLDIFIARAIYFKWSPPEIKKLLENYGCNFKGKISKSMKVDAFEEKIPISQYNMLLEKVSVIPEGKKDASNK